MDFVIRGWVIEDSGYSLDHFIEAEKAYDAALRLDPNLVSALLARSWASVKQVRLDPRADRDALLREADQLTSRAVALDGGDPSVWSARGWVLAWQRRWGQWLSAF